MLILERISKNLGSDEGDITSGVAEMTPRFYFSMGSKSADLAKVISKNLEPNADEIKSVIAEMKPRFYFSIKAKVSILQWTFKELGAEWG